MKKVRITEEQYQELDRLYSVMEKLEKNLTALRNTRVTVPGNTYPHESWPFDSMLLSPADDAYRALRMFGDFLSSTEIEEEER